MTELHALVTESKRQEAMYEALYRRHRRSLANATLYRRGEIELSYLAHRTTDGSIVANMPLPLAVEDQFRALAHALERTKDKIETLDKRLFDEGQLPRQERKQL